MTVWCRAGASLVLLLAMLVSPMASVLCALSCPDAGATTQGAAGHKAHATPRQSSASCHEDPAVTPERHVARTSAVASGVMWHRCQHPTTVTSSTVSDGLPLPPPIAATSMIPSLWARPRLAPPTPLPSSTRMPTARHVSGFSLALRI